MTGTRALTAGRDLGAHAVATAGWWRQLTWVTLRQQRVALMAVLGLFTVPATYMALNGLWTRHHFDLTKLKLESGVLFPYAWEQYPLYSALALLPVLAGIALGAPLVASEMESGTIGFAWMQGIGKGSWLIAKVIPVAVVLALAAAALGLEFRWWQQPYLINQGPPPGWAALLFGLNPLPYAGWMVLGFSLGVLAGTVARRTVPAVVATIVGYSALFHFWPSWRPYYLPPVHHVFQLLHTNSTGVYPFLLINPGQGIGQPDSRLGLFQCLELGWLVVASALLVAGAIALIRRRSA
ncbi:MAG TPA: ABC transporter permease subunit [Streptosporangiaceae bacterium]|nr:ABC transporter permease subunit [Streptosporangiaceae bacterium]